MEEQLVEIRKERENLLSNLVEAEYVFCFQIKYLKFYSMI